MPRLSESQPYTLLCTTKVLFTIPFVFGREREPELRELSRSSAIMRSTARSRDTSSSRHGKPDQSRVLPWREMGTLEREAQTRARNNSSLNRVLNVLSLCPLVRAICPIGAKGHPANWYGSKGRLSRGGAAMNALGSLTFLARSPANH
jgi:hypothetical protein